MDAKRGLIQAIHFPLTTNLNHQKGVLAMFQAFPEPVSDGILQLAQDYRADPRQEKIDLGIGVFRDAKGNTPIMGAVRAAEEKLLSESSSKAYLGPVGDLIYLRELATLALGESGNDETVVRLQTPGGCGALRVGLELVKQGDPDATVWVPSPTWPNHIPMVGSAGLGFKEYPYFDRASGTVDVQAMIDAVAKIPAGDVILLHGCCHNPTGADLSEQEWQSLSKIIAERGILPFVDMAYQGFGDSLEGDAQGMRAVFDAVPEAILTYSCSKNFGLYNERTAMLLVKCESEANAVHTLALLKKLTRVNYSMPPNHGAAIVRTILTDAELTQSWKTELDQMRQRVVELRQHLSRAFRDAGFQTRFDFLIGNKGMFSMLGISRDEVAVLRRDYAVYMTDDSRINIAGLQSAQIPALVQAIGRVINQTPA